MRKEGRRLEVKESKNTREWLERNSYLQIIQEGTLICGQQSEGNRELCIYWGKSIITKCRNWEGLRHTTYVLVLYSWCVRGLYMACERGNSDDKFKSISRGVYIFSTMSEFLVYRQRRGRVVLNHGIWNRFACSPIYRRG